MDDKFDSARRRVLFSAALHTDEIRPSSSVVRAALAAGSHRGRVSPENDDHYLVVRLGRSEETLFTSLGNRDVAHRFDEYAYAAVVSDGIGGNGAGAMAARLAISTLARLELRLGRWDMRIDPETASAIIDRSKRFYRAAHQAVLRWHKAHLEVGRMAATLTAVYTAGNHLFVANVGHSRCYLFRKGLLTQLTRDQTLRERLASIPQPTPVARGLEDMQHILTNSIGAEGHGPGVVVEHFRLADDDCLLLCTNGLTDMLSDDEIANVLASRRMPQEQCDQLIDAALDKGGRDNVTAVLANYHIPDLRRLTETHASATS